MNFSTMFTKRFPLKTVSVLIDLSYKPKSFYFRRHASSYTSQESTVFAPITGGLRSAVAVVRVSGPSTANLLATLGKFSPNKLPSPRVATLRNIYDTRNGSLLDRAMILWFPGPNSYTGEDCCEFHVHGSIAVMNGLLKSLNSFQDCRMAESGEFTRRAFLNGKMDLTEVEGLGDLIASETEMQRLQALKQMSGSLGKLYEAWRNRIAKCLAHVEAFIDFGEDENIEGDILERVSHEVNQLTHEMQVHLQDSRKGERLRSGVKLAIIGKPNAGKSSLLNILCRSDAAIVSSIPGTTRDVLTATVNIGGYPVNIADTAGLRANPDNVIETEGIRRAIREAVNADVVILLVDAQDAVECLTGRSSSEIVPRNRSEIIESQLQEVASSQSSPEGVGILSHGNIMMVANKLDLLGKIDSKFDFLSQFDATISCTTLEGYEEFFSLLTTKISEMCANPVSESPYLTHERYRSHLENCLQHLRQYGHVTEGSFETSSIDFSLEILPLKYAMNSIGSITGHFGTEDILDIIFKDFCIGK